MKFVDDDDDDDDEAMKQCSKLNVFFKSVHNSQPYHKSSAQLCHQELVEQLQRF